MKKNFFLIMLTCLSLASLAQWDKGKTPYSTKSLTGEAIKNVEVQTSGGSISVAGAGAAEQKIEVYISGNNGNNLSKDEIEKRLAEEYDLNIAVSNNKLTATAKNKHNNMNWKRALNISFKIYVPQNVSTDLSTSGGSINLSNLAGNQDFKTSGGSLNIQSLSGKVDGKTSGGSINVTDSKDDIHLSTSGGSINAKNCQGSLKLNTSGGSLNLELLKGNIEANTSGGNVHGSKIEGELQTHTSGGSIHLDDLACSLETSTSGGSVNVEMNGLGKYVKINNSGGNIDLTLPKNKGVDLDLSGRIADTHFENFDGKIDEHQVKGKLNGGGVPIDVQSGSGKIALSFK